MSDRRGVRADAVSSLHVQRVVDEDLGAVDVARFIRCQEHDDVADVGRLPDPISDSVYMLISRPSSRVESRTIAVSIAPGWIELQRMLYLFIWQCTAIDLVIERTAPFAAEYAK